MKITLTLTLKIDSRNTVSSEFLRKNRFYCATSYLFVIGLGLGRADIGVYVEVDEEEDDDGAVEHESPLHPQRKITSGVERPRSQSHHQEELGLDANTQRADFCQAKRLVTTVSLSSLWKRVVSSPSSEKNG